MRRWQVLFIAVGVCLDLLTKQLAQRFLSFWIPKTIIPSVLSFQLVHNYGAAYGIFQNQRLFLLAISATVIVGGIFFAKQIGTSRFARVGLVFLMIGAIGNFTDRLILGYVIDFIDIRIFPVFNLADVCIDIGIGCFIVDTIKLGRGVQA